MPHTARFRSDRRRILAVVVLANLLVALGLALVLDLNWERNRNGIEQILQAEAAFWADAMNQRYDQLQSTCSMAQRQLQRNPDLLQNAQPWLRDMDSLMPFIDGVSLVAADGTLLALETDIGNLGVGRPDFGTRPGFALALQHPGQVQIGLPQPDPLHPTQTITPARCALLTSSPQHPAVMLVFNVGLQAALRDLLQTLSTFDHKGRWVPAVGLIRSDGYLLARLPEPLAQTRADLLRAPARGVLARLIAAHPEQTHGTFKGPVQAAGGAELIGAWQRLGKHPVVAFTSLPVSTLAALWWRQSWPVLASWALVLLLQIAGGLMIARAFERQRRLAQINAALAQANQAVAEAADEATLLQTLCQITVGAGGMRLAWIGRPDASGQARVLAAAGETGYLDGLELSIHADRSSGRGPFGTVWRELRPIFVQDNTADALLAPWIARMQRFRLRTMAALPVRRGGRLYAVFSIYRDSRSALSREQRDLLEELARSLGRGLDRLDLAAAEQHARLSQQRQQELMRSVLAQIDILISARSDHEVLQSTCTRLLETGLFSAVWVAAPDEHGIARVLAAGGNAAEVLAAQPALYLDAAATHALARAWQSAVQARDDDRNSPLLQPWLDYSLPGWQPLALALPLQRGGQRWAVLVLALFNAADLDDALHALLTRVAGLIERALGEIDLKSQLEAEQAQQRHLARHDALTGLPNRLALEQHLPLAMARARRNKTLLAIGVMDLDDFKPVNDTHGHAAGDVLLQQLAQRLKAAVREADLVARLGGDEFVLVLEGLARTADLPVVLDRVHSAVDTPFDLGNGVQATVGMSLGVTLYPHDDAEPEVLLRHADAALYASKAHKADRTSWWQLWADVSSQPAEPVTVMLPIHADGYGDTAARLLRIAAPRLAGHADAFVARFYEALSHDAQSAALLATLSDDEFSHLRQQQTEHLLLLLSPDLSAEAHEERARRIGVTHALVGVGAGPLVSSMGWYLQSLLDMVADLPLRGSDRPALVQVFTARLQRELQWQTESAQELREQYQNLLFGLEQMLPELTQWADLARTVLQTVVELPGMAAAVIYKPDAQGNFVAEFTAGAFDAYMQAIAEQGVPPLQLDPNSPFGQTPHPRCWRSEQIETNTSYVTDPRMAPWRAAAHGVGIRSSAALPVKDSLGRMTAVMGLYGRYPAMFDTPAMRNVLRGLEQLFNRGMVGLMIRRGEALPAQDRRAWRQRLFSGGLEMHYQPVVNLHNGRPQAVEALARLRLDDGRLVPPGAFLPSFGTSELTRLFTLGLEQALHQLRTWDDQGLPLELSINLPPEVLLLPDCARWVADALQAQRIAPSRLRLEVLEDADFHNASERDAAVRRLAAIGVRLAMDDLGSGYSSLLRLRTLPFHTVKIDQGLVRQIPQDSPAQAAGTIGFIGALVRMTQGLGLQVVVEGLETVALVEMAAVLGADGGQGYALARPLPAAELPGWIATFGCTTCNGQPQTTLGRLAQQWCDAQAAGRAAPRTPGALALIEGD